MRNKNNGFTLVELSIVLVIIGLLISGLLVGQSMIRATKITRFTSDLRQYDILTNQFHEVYRYYPTDLPNATTYFGSCPVANDACDGNGDGHFPHTGQGSPSNTVWGYWWILSSAGLINESYMVSNFAGGRGSMIPIGGTHTPSVNLDGLDSWIFPYKSTASGPTYFLVSNNFYGVGVTLSTDGAVIPASALAVDAKIDDGVPTTGKVIAQDAANATANDCVTAGSAYNVSYSSGAFPCRLLTEMELHY